MPKIFGSVLAGGQSSRMGKDKRFLKFKGKSFLEKSCDLLAQTLNLEKSEIIILGNIEGVKCIKDENIGFGPLEGIRCLLKEKINCDAFLVVPVDMPLLNQETIELLINNFLSCSDKIDAVLFEQSELPVILRNSVRVQSVVEYLIDQENSQRRSFKELYHMLSVNKIDVLIADNLDNINNEYEYIKLNSSYNLHSN